MKFTETQLKSFAAPLSDTEEQKCKNAINMIRDAMKLIGYSDDNNEIKKYESDTYSFMLELRDNSGKNLTLLIQGSYANNTNVRTESDVDIAVILESTFIPKYREGVSGRDYYFSDGGYTVKKLKDEVEYALKTKYNEGDVKRKNKSIKVKGNTYRVDSDVVPAYRFRDYSEDFQYNSNNYTGGIEIRPDKGGKILNYPEQHIKNSKIKNNSTNYYFKKNVRIIKKMKCILIENGYLTANNVSSFGLESLLWNVCDDVYMKYSSYRFTFDEILKYIINDFHQLNNYKEANGIKPLFTTQEEINNYKDFIVKLDSFYEYDI